MQQTPLHDDYNPDILRLIPKNLKRIVEVGCSGGALAKAYLEMNPNCDYIGIEIDSNYAECAKNHCGKVLCCNIETLNDSEFNGLFPADCFIFGDCLEHLYDPWAVLRRIAQRMSHEALVIACIPNMQHWTIQASLNCGLFIYQDQGLMDRTHIRWFTRIGMIDLFESSGFKIVEGFPRIFENEMTDQILPAIGAMALALGEDPEAAKQDALPFQWVIKAKLAS